MLVHFLERFEQPDPAFAIEATDRPAKPQDGLGQFLFLRDILGSLDVELGELLFGNQIDRSNSLPVGGQPFQRFLLGLRIAEVGGIEA